MLAWVSRPAIFCLSSRTNSSHRFSPHEKRLARMKNVWMDEAMELARHGVGRTSPNPAVGAVLVNSGEIVGRGYHTYAQMKHAEILALEQAGDRARGATLYVTLEPCS